MNPSGFILRSVAKDFDGQRALADLSCGLPAGEHVAILGPSGCGKSTLLRLLSGLEAPTAGQILFEDKLLSDAGRILAPPHERNVGLVFQDLALWPTLTGIGNVLLAISGKRWPKSQRRTRAHEALALCGVVDVADRKVGTLSGGQQQRVALARALAAQPAFLLLDEPFSGLDLVTKFQILQDLSTLAARQRFTIVLVCHDPFEATALCREVMVLEKGRVVERGELAKLLRSPQSEILRVASRHLRGTQSSPVQGEK